MHLYIKYNQENTFNQITNVNIPYLLEITKDIPPFCLFEKTNQIKFCIDNFDSDSESISEFQWIQIEHNNWTQHKLYVEIVISKIPNKQIEIILYDDINKIKPQRKNYYKQRYVWFIDLYNKIDKNPLHRLLDEKEIYCIFRCFYESNKNCSNLYHQFISSNRDEYSKYKRTRINLGCEFPFHLNISKIKIKYFGVIQQTKLTRFD